MKISVVIPTHNRPDLLREALGSVERQLFADWEVVVVDDGSYPPVDLSELNGSLAENLVLIRHDRARGPSAARNSGIQAACGELITFLDDDDLLEPLALQQIDVAFGEQPTMDCLFLNVEPFGPGSVGTRRNQEQALSVVLSRMGVASKSPDGVILLDSRTLFDALLDHLPMAFQRVAIRRLAPEKVGLYKGKGFEDIEWYYLALRCKSGFLQGGIT